jgi:hypothetical protein
MLTFKTEWQPDDCDRTGIVILRVEHDQVVAFQVDAVDHSQDVSISLFGARVSRDEDGFLNETVVAAAANELARCRLVLVKNSHVMNLCLAGLNVVHGNTVQT